MDKRHGPPVAADQDDDGGLAAARLHVQALTDNGLSPEALLRALLEKCDSQQVSAASGAWPAFANPAALPPSTPTPTSTAGEPPSTLPPNPSLVDQHVAAAFESIASRGRHCARLSISTTNSASTARSRASVMSSATSISSTSSHGSVNRYSHLPGTQQFNSRPSTRAYWCTSCPQKLQRKFDWKRHEEEFHERYKKYPCPDCNRVFWGANTFNQHHKSRHSCTTCPHAEKVVRYSKRKRAWGCGFCAAFLPSLERYFDHVAVHYESGKTKAHWDHALVIYGLLHQPVVYDAWKALKVAKYGHLPREQQPKISWDPRNTGRSHGFLENENPGQLQDLLEFFDPSQSSAQTIVELAWEQAIHVTQATYDGLLDAANVRRPSQYMGQLQLPQQGTDQKMEGQEQKQAEQQAPRAQFPQHPQHPPPPPPQQEQQQQPQQEQAQQPPDLEQQQQQQTPLLKQEEDTPMTEPKWSPTSTTSSLQNGMVVQAPTPQSIELDSHPIPQTMAMDRSLTAPAFDQTFYSPVQVEYPNGALGTPPGGQPAPMEFVPFDQAMGFGSAPLMYNDWGSIASTMVDDPIGAPGPRDQQPPQQQLHAQRQLQAQQLQVQQMQAQQMQARPQLQQMQHQQAHPQHQAQAFWSTGLYPSHP
ncbi:hypothetical protein RB598_000054 [Gaeumannomyces tritici]